MDPAPAPLPIHDHGLAERLVLVVAGAHPRAEAEDRPGAYRLADRIRPRLGPGAGVLVCSDLWYLNDDRLRAQPTVSVGGPDVNALTAYLGNKVPSAFAIDGRLVVQLDVELVDLVACCWGVNAEQTGAAIDAFCQRYLHAFVDAAERRWER